MKKEYKKPELLFDNFELSVSIAGDCGSKTQTPSRNQCGIDIGSEILFSSGMNVCNTKIEDSTEYCYHVPTDANRMFNS